MTTKTTILVADDDPHIRQIVRFAVEKAGYGVVEAKDGADALAQFAAAAPDLVVLDITMPEMEGTEVCQKIRAQSQVPIVFLSSRDDEIDRIIGLELGGDDYLTKPFSPRELVARIKAVLRRTGDNGETSNGLTTDERSRERVVEHGQVVLDLDRFQAFWGDDEVELTRREFELLRALLGYPGKVFSRDELMNRAYAPGTIVSDRTIDSHIRRLRSKFEAVGASPVETVHGIGYKVGSCK
ncbi:MAG: response regulator transcription factor [Bradymonadaceae bacterium]